MLTNTIDFHNSRTTVCCACYDASQQQVHGNVGGVRLRHCMVDRLRKIKDKIMIIQIIKYCIFSFYLFINSQSRANQK